MNLYKIKSRADDGEQYKAEYVEAETAEDALRVLIDHFGSAQEVDSLKLVSTQVIR